MIRVVLVDDQPLVRAGLRMILAPEDGFEIVAERADGAAAVAAAAARRPDPVLMDVRMKGMDGVEATRRLRAAAGSPPVPILTTFDDDEVLSAALRAGASGFLLKDAPAEELIRAARLVASGDAWLDPAVTGRVLATHRAGAPPVPDDRAPAALTAREGEVLRLIGRGLTNGAPTPSSSARRRSRATSATSSTSRRWATGPPRSSSPSTTASSARTPEPGRLSPLSARPGSASPRRRCRLPPWHEPAIPPPGRRPVGRVALPSTKTVRSTRTEGGDGDASGWGTGGDRARRRHEVGGRGSRRGAFGLGRRPPRVVGPARGGAPRRPAVRTGGRLAGAGDGARVRVGAVLHRQRLVLHGALLLPVGVLPPRRLRPQGGRRLPPRTRAPPRRAAPLLRAGVLRPDRLSRLPGRGVERGFWGFFVRDYLGGGIELGHLWFVAHLLVYAVGDAAWRRVAGRRGAPAGTSLPVPGHGAVLAHALGLAAAT